MDGNEGDEMTRVLMIMLLMRWEGKERIREPHLHPHP